jgi:hypothetical protein
MAPVFENPSVVNVNEGGLTFTCPPHHWVVDMEATKGVHLACCRKCGARTGFPAYIESDWEEGIYFGMNRSVVSNAEPVERVKQSEPAALRSGSDKNQTGGCEN